MDVEVIRVGRTPERTQPEQHPLYLGGEPRQVRVAVASHTTLGEPGVSTARSHIFAPR